MIAETQEVGEIIMQVQYSGSTIATTDRIHAKPRSEHHCSGHDHHHGDGYTAGHAKSMTYRRVTFQRPRPSSPQMGGNDFPSAQYQMGSGSRRRQTQMMADMGSVPKTCYYCKPSWGDPTGKCAKDAPEWGSGKDYMGNDCSSCRGTGKCAHCGGDGVLG